MSAFTLRYRAIPSDAEIGAVESAALRHGARIAWRQNAGLERAYALVESDGAAPVAAVREATRGTVFETPIIALAVSPSVAEALPPLLHALGGPGRPDGIIACEAVGETLLVEWNLDRTGLDVVLGLVDIEIDRFRARRVNTLLSPLPLAWWTRIAATGLRAAEIAPDRVLEALLEEYHVAG